ncbi:CDP-alcohol phosphatidyltransferase family protein [Rufibacter quisquiliarum]|uniref:CDP-diacylglycerol--glycerol-3-phosphate 3-phosphatidyltransferase n=1 Tax=Rufibacter quisquiliarum TaxID=1549639 RepID=A0A839GJS3_9BACT|nr:CDP-alcohol phosphatidyltransferase family protein [Rufibacter quisquiliarum]MBA9077029.1 CDP-diacylglycerol--glycerol-3-phosphate 3-phosphatidyltransferase [Rufibacter quisquiliarum]
METSEKLELGTSDFEVKQAPKEKAWKVFLQQGIYKIVNPFVRLLIRLGFTPNAVTTTGFILNIGVAVIFVVGGESENRHDMAYVGWAGFLIMMAGLFDMLDGQVARMGNMGSTFGALFDSVLDRYSEMVMFLGICYYLIAHHYFLSSLVAFVAMIGSMMVSYTRARAEGLGVDCKGGFFQRPERVVLIALAGMFCGLGSALLGGDFKLMVPGIPFPVFETISIFTIPLAILAVFTNVTAFTRLREAKEAIELKERREAGLR